MFCEEDADCGATGACDTSTTFSVPMPGREIVLDATDSFLDQCVDGTVQAEFVECRSSLSGDPCGAPQDGTLLRSFSSDARLAVSPETSTRYRVRIRCSSQPPGSGCLAERDARVLVYDLGGLISIEASCEDGATGAPGHCDPGEPLRLDLRMPAQAAGVDGLAVHRVGPSGLASPVLEGGVCVETGVGAGLVAGDPLTWIEPTPFLPSVGEVAFYLVTHDVPATERSAGNARIGGLPTARFVTPDCPP